MKTEARSFALALLLFGCLPVDETPLSEVMVTLRGSQEFAHGTSTESADGWEIVMDHSVLGLHTLSLFRADGGGDPDSAVSGYTRALSPSWAEPQKIALLFARGTCHFEYQLGRLPGARNVQASVVWGPSVSEEDWKALQETTRAFAADPVTNAESEAFRDVVGPDWFVEGGASKGGKLKRFRWLFWELSPSREGDCPPGQLPSVSVDDEGGTSVELATSVESLFQSALQSGDESLYFDDLALLDANEDGWISQAEIEQPDGMPGESTSPYRRTVARLQQELIHIGSPVRCLPADGR